MVYQGFYGDAARTVPVGKISNHAERLLRVTRAALYAGIEQAQVGNRISDIARAVQQTAETCRFLGGDRLRRTWHRTKPA